MPSRLLMPRRREVELGTSFLVLPFRLTMRVIVLAVITITLDNLLQDQYVHLPRYIRMSAEDSKTILATLAGGSITVVALVVSLMMVVLSLVAASFGPRIILNFVRRRTTQVAIGSFVAVFVYSLVTLATVFSGARDRFAPILSTWTAVLMVLLATGLLVVFVQDISSSVQLGNMLSEISKELDQAIVRQRALAQRAHSSTKVEIDTSGWHAVEALETGYVQAIDFDAVIEIARRNDCVIRLLHRAGSFANAGRPLAETSVALGPGDLVLLRKAVVRGTYRTMEQDLEYAIAEYVEIALRALSPAVNDPATAISCIDWIGDSLVSLSVEPIGVSAFADASGALRVVLPANSLRRVVAAAFNELRQAASGTPAVAIRMLTTIDKVVPSVHEAEVIDELRSQVEAIVATATAGFLVPRDRDDLHAAADVVRASLDRARP
ncbi:MAG: DUF2254 domain-containing protein [Ilumatobacteraceae bacterium]